MKMQQMIKLARALVYVDEDIVKQEEKVKELKRKAMRLREETIPSFMQELGVTTFTLTTGQVIKVTQKVYASIPVENRPKAYIWLEEHGLSGIIKSKVSVEFGRNELEKAGELAGRLNSEGLECDFTEKVHPTTLQATLKQEIANGTAIPMDLFGARAVFVASVK